MYVRRLHIVEMRLFCTKMYALLYLLNAMYITLKGESNRLVYNAERVSLLLLTAMEGDHTRYSFIPLLVLYIDSHVVGLGVYTMLSCIVDSVY